MIKGPMAVQLMEFSSSAGIVFAKGSIKDLVKGDVEPLVDTTINIFETALKEPSFTKENNKIFREIESALNFKDTVLKKSDLVIKGNEKRVVLEKAKYWYDLVQNLFGNCLFSTLSEDSVSKLFPEELTDQIGDKNSNDIRDAVWCLVYSLPTPAAMLLFRTAEGELRKYVKKVAGKPCDKWNDNLKKLEESGKANRSIKKDFDWLKDKRNEVEHPDKRYTQDEAEEILHRLSGLLKSIYNEGKDD